MYRRDASLISEYVSPAGTVFRVPRNAHTVPNLHELQENYLSNVQQGLRFHRIPQRAVTTLSNDFILTNFGRMMSLHGRAGVPSLIPTSLTPHAVE